MNMLTAQYAIGLGQEGFTTISVTPGVSDSMTLYLSCKADHVPVAEDRHG